MVSTRNSTRKSSGLSPEAPTATTTATVSPVAAKVNKRNGAATNGADHDAKRRKVAEPVDKTRWRLNADDGRHTWHYLDDDQAVKEWPQSYADKWYLDLPLVRVALTQWTPPLPAPPAS